MENQYQFDPVDFERRQAISWELGDLRTELNFITPDLPYEELSKRIDAFEKHLAAFKVDPGARRGAEFAGARERAEAMQQEHEREIASRLQTEQVA